MAFFRKSPVAIRSNGLTHLLTVIITVTLAFLPAFALAPMFSKIGMGWLFFDDNEIANKFNALYTKEYNRTGYFDFFLLPFRMLSNINFSEDANVSLQLSIGVLISLWIMYLYLNLIFRHKFAPFYIHPKSIRKSFFIRIKKRLFDAIKKNKFWSFMYAMGCVAVYLMIVENFSEYYYLGWEKLFRINKSNYNTGFLYEFRYSLPIYILDVSAKFIIPYFFIWFSLSTSITWLIFKESKPFRKLRSLGRPSARWGGVGSYILHDFDTLMKKNKNKFSSRHPYKNPIYLGTTLFTSDPKLGGRHFGLDTDSHMLTIAQTGAGKSRDVLHTNLAIWPNGLFILDPKGEHAQRTYYLRKAAGFPVYLVDPYGLCSHINASDSLNLLEEIDPNSLSAADDIQTITYACIPPDDKETGNAKHFRETAQMLFAGIVAHVLTRFPKEEQTLTTVFDLFLSGKPDGTLIDQEGFFKVLGEMAGNTACGKLPMQGVAMLLNIREGERGSIYSTFMRAVSWTQSEAIKRVLSKSTFSLNDIRGRNATVYLVLPFGYMRAQARWIRSIIGLCFKRAEFPRTPTKTDKKALFVLDEFLQLETCKAVQDAFATLRGAGVKLWLLSQSLSDIKEYYAKHKTMIGACDKQFFGTDDLDDTKYIEDFLGEYEKIITEGKEDETRSHREINKLSTASSIRETIQKSEAGEGYQIVKSTEGLPVSLNLVPCYWVINKDRYGEFQEKVMPEIDKRKNQEEEQNQEFLSPDEVTRILRGEGRIKKKSSSSGGIPKSGEKGPLRRDIDNLKEAINDLKEEIRNSKNNG